MAVLAMLLSASAGAAALPMLPAALADETLLDGLARAATWSARFDALAPLLPGADAPAPRAEETRPLPALFESLYARLGAQPTPAQAAQLRASLAGLDPALAWNLQQLLGAIDDAMAGWSPTAPPRAAAARMLGVLDHLRPVAGEGGEVVPFDGPNTGLLFNDPFNLVLVGGPGPSVYRGHTFYASVDPGDHLLILDVGGDDLYANHPASARPTPNAGVCGPCHGGLPVSVLVDLEGNDVYAPAYDHGSMGHGAHGGLGLLADLAGDDQYVANVEGSEGSGLLAGFGLLLDGGGDDVHRALGQGQGAGNDAGALGLFLDVAGRDTMLASCHAQGAAVGSSTALFADLGGDDTVSANCRSQGWADPGGKGWFLNVGGDDSYAAGSAARGYTSPCGVASCALPNTPALFVDACGSDAYAGGMGRDGSVWQQNALGLGRDDNC